MHHTHVRTLLLAALALVPAAGAPAAPPFEMDMVVVPGGREPGGPRYTFLASRFMVTNQQFCIFLNDAEANQDNERGQFTVYAVWGDVYLDSTFDSSERIYWISDWDNSRLRYDRNAPLGQRFSVIPGYEDHPVNKVSWMGACKFCNWLTIVSGLGLDQRVYNEGPDRDDWFPRVTTKTDYLQRELTFEERVRLVNDFRGFRLLMDDNGPVTTEDNMDYRLDVSPFAEYVKLATFDPDAPALPRLGVGGVVIPPLHWQYGFGRDVLTGADGNYFGSGDPFEGTEPPWNDNGGPTTPVGYYNGINENTNPNNNFYGAYDLSGNLWDWTQDRGSTWNLKIARAGAAWVGPQHMPAARRFAVSTVAHITVGFRVARTPVPGDFDGDDDVDILDFSVLTTCFSGSGQTVGPDCAIADLDFDGDVDLADFATFSTNYTGSRQ